MDTIYIHRSQDMTKIFYMSKAIIITANFNKKSNLYLALKDQSNASNSFLTPALY